MTTGGVDRGASNLDVLDDLSTYRASDRVCLQIAQIFRDVLSPVVKSSKVEAKLRLLSRDRLIVTLCDNGSVEMRLEKLESNTDFVSQRGFFVDDGKCTHRNERIVYYGGEAETSTFVEGRSGFAQEDVLNILTFLRHTAESGNLEFTSIEGEDGPYDLNYDSFSKFQVSCTPEQVDAMIVDELARASTRGEVLDVLDTKLGELAQTSKRCADLIDKVKILKRIRADLESDVRWAENNRNDALGKLKRYDDFFPRVRRYLAYLALGGMTLGTVSTVACNERPGKAFGRIFSAVMGDFEDEDVTYRTDPPMVEEATFTAKPPDRPVDSGVKEKDIAVVNPPPKPVPEKEPGTGDSREGVKIDGKKEAKFLLESGVVTTFRGPQAQSLARKLAGQEITFYWVKDHSLRDLGYLAGLYGGSEDSMYVFRFDPQGRCIIPHSMADWLRSRDTGIFIKTGNMNYTGATCDLPELDQSKYSLPMDSKLLYILVGDKVVFFYRPFESRDGKRVVRSGFIKDLQLLAGKYGGSKVRVVDDHKYHNNKRERGMSAADFLKKAEKL